MQQTENLKLNLIETGDLLSPAPINENAEKIEAAILAQEAAAKEVTDGLDGRVETLEARKIITGTYRGDGTGTRFIELGFNPKAILIFYKSGGSVHLITKDIMLYNSTNPAVYLVEGGIQIKAAMLNTQTDYAYIAFL